MSNNDKIYEVLKELGGVIRKGRLRYPDSNADVYIEVEYKGAEGKLILNRRNREMDSKTLEDLNRYRVLLDGIVAGQFSEILLAIHTPDRTTVIPDIPGEILYALLNLETRLVPEYTGWHKGMLSVADEPMEVEADPDGAGVHAGRLGLKLTKRVPASPKTIKSSFLRYKESGRG